jgi:membrane-bound lytic murein transglycosylase B
VWTDEFLGDAGGDLSAVLAGRIKDQERTGGIPNAVLDGMLASVQRHDRVELARDRLEAAARRWAQPFEGRTVMTVSVSGTAILTALREIDKAREVTSDAL